MHETRLIILLIAAAVPSAAADCMSLMNVSLPNTTITVAQPVGAGEWPMRAGAAAQNPPFCRVTAVLKPSSDSHIEIEVWMPEHDWNGKYQAVGNGGWSGSIPTSAMTVALAHGYATSGTDTGHKGSRATFALGHPEQLIDYAWRSEHEMTVAAKALIAIYYGRPPAHSYWDGCSAGGKQALMEAQRFPEDYDGIVAGAPAANWVGRATQALWTAQAVHKDPASYIPPDQYPAIHAAVLKACDSLDGVTDGVIEDPRRCHFDPAVLADSLTPAQIEAVRKIYGPSINPRTKRPLYPGLEPGSELGWATWAGPQPLAIALDHYRFVVFEKPEWDYLTLDFDRDVSRGQKLDARRINALDPDLRPFFARGGKLIQYHGWSDPQIAPGNSVDYYRSVVTYFGGAAKIGNSYRLFMVPGMAHCGGGEGPNNFDMVAALEEWVEQKRPPARIPASRIRDGRAERTRPLCPYPQTAVYKGSGSTGDEKNFECKVVSPIRTR